MCRIKTIQRWYVEHNQDIYQYLVYFTGRTDVEDLVQETFIRAIKSYDKFQGRANPKTWLFSIARGLAIDAYRKNSLLALLPRVLQERIVTEKSPIEQLVADEELVELYRALTKLKRSYREVFILRAIKEFSVSETAAILNWSEAKVNTTYHRSCKAIREKYLADQKGVDNHVFLSK